MIHEHEALELASAAIDFGLSPELERELNLQLRDCPVCAERAAAYREQIRLMRRLPVVDASDATRRRVTAAALSGRTEARSPMLVLLAAALLVGLLLGATAVVGSMLDDRDRDPLTIVDPSESPISSAVAVAPSQSAAPTQSPVTPGGPVGPLPADSIVEVVGTNLRVRSLPGVGQESIMYDPFLQPGDLLFVMSGPVDADDYDWYETVPIGGEGSRSAGDLPLGWVASADHDGTPWVRPAAPDCPRPPVDLEVLESMSHLARVACHGSGEMELPAIVQRGADDGCVGGPCGPTPWSGGWIATSNSVRPPSGASVEVAIDPASGVTADDIGTDRLVVLHGAFDRAAALGCDEDGANPAANLSDQVACRALFVVDRVDPDPSGLRVGSDATVVTDDLRVRSKPYVADDSILLTPLLGENTRLVVIGGPVLASGYTWYEVTVPSESAADGGPMTGWVAAGKDGQPWIAADES